MSLIIFLFCIILSSHAAMNLCYFYDNYICFESTHATKYFTQ